MLNYIYHKIEAEYHHLSLWYFVAFIFGIIFFFQSRYVYSLYSILAFVFFLLILSIFLFKKNLLLFFISMCLLGFSCGILSSYFRINTIKTNPIQKIITSNLTGRIENIKPSIRGMQITLVDVSLDNKKVYYLKKIRINIANKFASNLSHSDVIKLKAKLFPLQSSVLPGTYDFGFYMYMSGIQASGYAITSPEIIGNNKSFFNKKIQDIRQKIYKRLLTILGKNEGEFAAAILIGETKAIPKDVSNNMRNSGIAHILSVSGLHLSLVAMIFFVFSRMLLNCSNYMAHHFDIKLISAFISIIGSFLYLQISGGNIAATRAFIMTMIFIVAIMLGRSPYQLRSVMVAAILILLFLPEYVFHPSFQLSFTAVLCLISGYEFCLKHKQIYGASKGIAASIKFYIFTNIYSSFLASIVTAPFVIYHFYKFASYSILMNLIAVPIMSFCIMPLALLSIILMPISLDGIVLKLLGFFIDIINQSAAYIVKLPNSVLTIGHISPLSLLIFSFGFFWICLWQTSWRFWGIIFMILSCFLMLANKKPDLIYDHTIKMIGVKNNSHKLDIYAEDRLSSFISDYWISWYGQNAENITTKKQITRTDQIFTLPSGKTISFNYWRCLDANIQIITSKKLYCKKSDENQIISNESLQKYKQILIYCDELSKFCKVQYGE